MPEIKLSLFVIIFLPEILQSGYLGIITWQGASTHHHTKIKEKKRRTGKVYVRVITT